MKYSAYEYAALLILTAPTDVPLELKLALIEQLKIYFL